MMRNSGFSLVELMIAMVIGLIIILGAGQLFLTVFQSNQQVRVLSEKQAAVNFAVETLIRDVRRADWVASPSIPNDGTDSFTVSVTNRGDCPGADGVAVTKTYSLDNRDVDGVTKYFFGVGCDPSDPNNSEEIVGGFSENGFNVAPVGDYGVLVTLTLVPTDDNSGNPESLSFVAVNRTASVGGGTGGGGGDGDNGPPPVCNGPPWPGGKPAGC